MTLASIKHELPCLPIFGCGACIRRALALHFGVFAFNLGAFRAGCVSPYRLRVTGFSVVRVAELEAYVRVKYKCSPLRR